MADEYYAPTLAEVLQRNALDPYPESGTEMPRGDARHPPFARAYDQSWRDRLASVISGENADPFRRLLAFRILGSSGLGPSADPNTPWRAMPVAAPAIDAAEAAYNDQHGKFAANALDAGLEAWGVAGLPGLLARTAVKPPLPVSQPFNVTINNKSGQPIGDVFGRVAGDKAHISGAYRTELEPGVRAPNSVGYGEMRRVFDAIREQFPNTARVTATRVSGARHGRAAAKGADDVTETLKQRIWEPGNVVDEALGVADRLTKYRLSESALGEHLWEKMSRTAGDLGSKSALDVAVTPEWQRILNEAGKRGIR